MLLWGIYNESEWGQFVWNLKEKMWGGFLGFIEFCCHGNKLLNWIKDWI